MPTKKICAVDVLAVPEPPIHISRRILHFGDELEVEEDVDVDRQSMIGLLAQKKAKGLQPQQQTQQAGGIEPAAPDDFRRGSREKE